MNSNLYDRKAKLPKSLVDYLTTCFNKNKNNTESEGYKRIQNIIEKKQITYSNLKRIKNWFDSHNSDDKVSYELNGGDRMKKWCNHVLEIWRKNDKLSKKHKSEGGLENQFIKNHEKDGVSIVKNSSHKKGLEKYGVDTKITEELNKINKLINYEQTKR